MTKREIRVELKRLIKSDDWQKVESWDDPNNKYLMLYLGSYMSLDPCGRYHHILSPNGATNRCMQYWENLENVASELNCWTESGEGDPTDIFLCKPA